ncbi:hypothetical protein [Sporosarcina aquimarina]|uniref:hypothetical protein n=1 Tax=Sporosarcina aquimarina TaxID=114975 RepID=UPI001FE726CE|nr:hypothetical protein [Sporosarcina aquimarina]
MKKQYTYNRDKSQRYGLYVLTHSNEETYRACQVKPTINDKRIKHRITKAVKDILTDTSKIAEYIDSDFDEAELSRLAADVKRLEKMKSDVHSKMDKLLDLYLDDKWSKEKLDERHRLLEKQAHQIQNDLKERKRKRNLIQKDKLNFDTVAEFFGVASRFEELLDPVDQQKLIGSLFPSATLGDDLLILHALLPQEVTVDVKIRIESMEEAKEREILENARERYALAQKTLTQHRGLSLEALSKMIGSQPSTLKLDQERFGSFKHLAPNKQCPDLKKQRVIVLQDELRKNPKLSGRQLEKLTGINRKMIYKIMEEEELKR